MFCSMRRIPISFYLVIVAERAGDITATLDALATSIELSDADRTRVLRKARLRHRLIPILIRANLS